MHGGQGSGGEWVGSVCQETTGSTALNSGMLIMEYLPACTTSCWHLGLDRTKGAWPLGTDPSTGSKILAVVLWYEKEW